MRALRKRRHLKQRNLLTKIMLRELRNELRKRSTLERAKASGWFFKTGKGQYAEGDKFIGVSVPEQRMLAKKYKDIELIDLQKLISSKIHEERLTALFILINKFSRAKGFEREKLFRFYVVNLKYVNNWDLVDSSAHKIIGEFLIDKKITLLLLLAKSENLWERRIAVISTFAFLGKNNSKPTYAVVDLLLSDREDLIQKAVGWALRECGKRVDEKELEEYLKLNFNRMGRTALRYSIEKFGQEKRLALLHGNF